MMSEHKKNIRLLVGADLTRNQRVFADEYCIDRNGSRAYMKAYVKVKKTETAKAAAARLLTNVNVQGYVDYQLKRLSEKAQVTTDQVLKEECLLAFSDIRKLFRGQSVPLSPADLPEEVARAICAIDVKEIVRSIDDSETILERSYKFRFWDKGRALNRLAKHLGMHRSKFKGIENGIEGLGRRLKKAIEQTGRRTMTSDVRRI